MTLNSLFIRRDRKKSTRGTEIVFSQMSPLYHFHVSESKCPGLPLCQAMWRLPLLWVPGWNCLLNRARHCFTDETGVCLVCCGLSHTAVLLSGLVHRTGLWGVEGRSECAQEASQQCEAQSTPRTKHGPAVTMTDVLWYAEHVARIARQFKVDSGHTRAKGDNAARPCERARMKEKKQVSNPVWSLMRRYSALINKDHTAPLRWVRAVLFM